MSAHPFGLGACRAVDQVVVEWPSGKRQVLKAPAVNRYLAVREP
ncbi:MAG: ASPIC/UnbV domain-containing protein [Candidatus Hydrogenedentes bacterium]|nr:ASPIC/UnbV domain-containing protein [Candidatus Hydrogenedentota bacterium]